MVWDVSTQLRQLNASYWNVHRGDRPAREKAELLPTPEDRGLAAEPDRPVPDVAAEREWLQTVLARPNPR